VALWVQRFKRTGTVDDAPRDGRPVAISKPALTKAKKLVLTCQSTRLATQQMKAKGQIAASISYRTVHRHLSSGSNGIRCKRPTRKLKITPKTAGKRRDFATFHLRRRTVWRRVLFLDSKYFYLSKQGTKKVWVPKDATAVRHVQRHSPGLHVYGGFCYHGVTSLVEASGTHKFKWVNPADPEAQHKGVGAAEYQSILRAKLLPDAQQLFGGKQWQMLADRAKPHVAHTTQAFLAAQKVQVVQHWPSNSPDLNPIENLWAWVQHRVNEQHITTVDGLKSAVQRAWRSVPKRVLENLARSMPTRLKKVMALDGGATGY
jgi:hypothetical protein